jgi:hypothetical protein
VCAGPALIGSVDDLHQTDVGESPATYQKVIEKSIRPRWQDNARSTTDGWMPTAKKA